MVSRNSHPLSGTTNDWRIYSFPAGRVIEYPGIGLDAQALYVSYNFNTSWIVLDKAQLLNGTTNATTMNRVAVGSGTQGLQVDRELWFCNSVASSNQPRRTVTRWYKLNVGGFPSGQATLAEWGDLDGGTNTWRNHPAIHGNARGDVCVTFTQSASNAFSSFRAAIRKAGQTNFQEVIIRQSTAAFTQVGITNNGLPAARWANYCLVTPDPVDQTFWANHLTILVTNSTSTWWANIARDNVLYVDRGYIGTETGSYTQPFNTVNEAHAVATSNQTFLIRPGNYPETLLPRRFNKTGRMENPYGATVHLGP